MRKILTSIGMTIILVFFVLTAFSGHALRWSEIWIVPFLHKTHISRFSTIKVLLLLQYLLHKTSVDKMNYFEMDLDCQRPKTVLRYMLFICFSIENSLPI